MGGFDGLRRFDVYSTNKTHDDLKVRTLGGAAISICCCIFAALLFVSEFKSWRSLETVDRLDVDTTARPDGKLMVNMDIYLPSLPCGELVTEVTDESGSQELHVTDTLQKLRMDRNGVPIDVPFTEINKLIAAQMVGRTYPEDGSGPVDVTVKSANVVPSGDRLLISLLVRAKEKKSWFGLGAEATVHIWGRPVLDQARQTLRLADIELAVESEAAFGLLGAAARAAVPQMQQALLQKATLDLKPIAANAREKIAAAIADYQKSEDGLRVEARIDSLTLADIAFDSKTLRVVAEAGGSLNVYVTKLSGM